MWQDSEKEFPVYILSGHMFQKTRQYQTLKFLCWNFPYMIVSNFVFYKGILKICIPQRFSFNRRTDFIQLNLSQIIIHFLWPNSDLTLVEMS